MKHRKGIALLISMLLVLSVFSVGLAEEVKLVEIEDCGHELPLVPEGEEVTLTIFQSYTPLVQNLQSDGNLVTALVEETTGLKLEFITALEADVKTKLNLLLNSGDYPDIISGPGDLSRSEMNYYAQQGIFIPMDDYLEEYAPNASSIFASNAAAKNVCSGSDGKIYSLPDINECFHCLYGEGRAWYYMPWLVSINDDVMPQTTEELKQYLIAIRDGDPNGNGIADEIPIAFHTDASNSGPDRFVRWVSNFYTPPPAISSASITTRLK